MRRAICLVVLLLCFASMASAQELALFGGYSFLQTTGASYEHVSTNGWNAEVSASRKSWGVVADFSNHYGAGNTNFSPLGSRGRGTTIMFGPQFTFRHIPKVKPFVHALFGEVQGARPGPQLGIACPSPLCNVSTFIGETDFAMAFGGGIDIFVRSHVWIRPIQVDYIRQSFSNGAMNSPRISAGIVIRSGKR